MKKKTKIVLSIVGASLLGAGIITLGIFYWLKPTDTMNFLNMCWEKVNEPLPVVGVSAFFIGMIVWKLFVSSSYGKKKYNKLKAEYEELKSAFKEACDTWEEDKKKIENGINVLRELNKNTNDFIINVRDANPCKRVRDVKEITYERKETINDETADN